MALQGFDKTYYLNAKLAALQTEYPEWASKTAADLEAYFANVGLTAEDHYNLYGWKEGLGPNAYFDAEEYKLAKATAMFDDNLYLSVGDALAAFEAAWGDQDPYLHYLQYGAAEGINPSNDFDSSDYLAAKLAALQANPETAADWADKTVDDLLDVFVDAGLTPLTHFILYGADEGLAAPPVPEDEQVTPGTEIPPVEGETITLTDGVDNVQIATVNTVDTVIGVVDGDESTFSVGDVIEGNGHTVLKLAVAEGGDADYATLSDIDQINILAGTSGGDRGELFLAQVATGVNFNAVDWTGIGSVNLVSGVDGLGVRVDNLESTTALSISDAVGGRVEADYTNDIWVQIETDRDSAISFMDGDVDAVVATDEDVKFGMRATDDDVDVVVGDVSMVGTDANWAGLDVGNWYDKGDVTLGNVIIEGFDTIYMNIDNEESGTLPANLAVGDVTLDVNAAGYLIAGIENYGNGAPAGNLTLGNVDIELAAAASGYFQATNAGGIAAGDLTVGDVSVKLATDAVIGSIGDIIPSKVATNNAIDYNLSFINVAETAGNLTIGNIALDMGINTFLAGSNELQSLGTAGSVGDTTIGDLTVLADDGAELNYHPVDIDANGDAGNVTQGNVDVTLGVSAEAYLHNNVHSEGGDIGDYSRGDVSLVAGQGSDIQMTDGLYANNGDIGDVTIGDVALSAGVSAAASYTINSYATSSEIGNIAVGDVSVNAAGKNAYADFYEYIYSEDVGTTTYGDVSLAANGDGANALFYLFNSATDSAGDTTLGNFDLSIDTLAEKTAYVKAHIAIDNGDVTIGDITLGSTSVQSLTDTLMAYTVDFNAHAYNGTLTVGDITVTGGDGKADNFADIANWLNLSSSEKVVIGNVDYSGYGGGAVTANVIDVSGYGGAAEVIGSDQKDMIYDNKGINAMTGGDGADTFVINAANSGKTATTVDQILDFNDADGDKIDLGVVINEFNYSEGTHADFDTFLAAANAADKAAYSGLVAGDVWVAVDNNGDLAVNYVIQLVGVNSLGDIDIASFDPIAG